MPQQLENSCQHVLVNPRSFCYASLSPHCFCLFSGAHLHTFSIVYYLLFKFLFRLVAITISVSFHLLTAFCSLVDQKLIFYLSGFECLFVTFSSLDTLYCFFLSITICYLYFQITIDVRNRTLIIRCLMLCLLLVLNEIIFYVLIFHFTFIFVFFLIIFALDVITNEIQFFLNNLCLN